MATPTDLANQVQVDHALDATSNCADLSERTKTMHSLGARQGRIANFLDSFERIEWLYLLFKCGIKTKTHFGRVL